MRELVLLYWGCIFLMYLSSVYYPVDRVAIQNSRRSFMWHRADMFLLIVIIALTCFSFLRTEYNDTLTYRIHFMESETAMEFFSRKGYADITSNPLSELYRDSIRDLTSNYHIYFFFPAFFSSFAVVKLFKRYSVSPAFSMIVFFSIGTYVMYIAALKQCFAMFFLLLALPYALDKKYGRFYLLVFIAILFHTHAFMFAIVPFLLGKPWGKIEWLGAAVMVVLMVTYNQTMRVFMETAQSLGALVAEEEVFDGHQINVIRVLVYWITPILALTFKKRLFTDSTRMENLFVNMSIVSAMIISIGLVEGANLYARMAAYFEIATAVALPWIIKKLFTVKSAKVITLIAIGLYFGYFLFEFGVAKNFDSEYYKITLWQFLQELLA